MFSFTHQSALFQLKLCFHIDCEIQFTIIDVHNCKLSLACVRVSFILLNRISSCNELNKIHPTFINNDHFQEHLNRFSLIEKVFSLFSPSCKIVKARAFLSK